MTRWVGVIYVFGFFVLYAAPVFGLSQNLDGLLLGIFYWPGGLIAAALAVIVWNIQHGRIHRRLQAEHGWNWQDYCRRCRHGWEREAYSANELWIRDTQRARRNKEEHQA